MSPGVPAPVDIHRPWAKLERACADGRAACRRACQCPVTAWLSLIGHSADVAAVLRALLARPSIANRLAALLECGRRWQERAVCAGAGAEPEAIATTMALPLDEVEKALVQMRSARPETTRGTLNVTLAAHR